MPSWSDPANLPAELPLPSQAVGYVLRRAVEHMRELDDDAGTVTVAGGDTVDLVCTSAVRDWLSGLATRAEAGERL